MFRNYFKTAIRNLANNKFYTLINLTGLTAGLSVGILILLWVQDEFSFDRFHKNAKSIYRLENRVGTGASTQIWQETVAPIGMMAKAELPEVTDYVRITGNYQFQLFKYKDKVFNELRTDFTDPSLFSVFDFNLVKGNPLHPFTDDHSMIITESTAKRYFGNEEPLGKIIVADDKANFTVTGIIKDFPENSSFHSDMFMPMSLFAKTNYEGLPAGASIDNDFTQFNYSTFLVLKKGTDLAALPAKLKAIHLRNKSDDTDILYLVQSLADMHLYKADGTDGGMATTKMFAIIALVILVIACINYVNLSTARSMLRSKEVSLRKIVGAAKAQLFFQFILETSLLFLVAAILSIGAVYLLIPSFNRIAEKQIVFDLANFQIWKVILLTIGATLIASSIYPAILLSSFDPLKAIKGKLSARISDVVFRRILVVLQFTFSVILIAGTLVIGNQLRFIRQRELGYDKEHVLSFNMQKMIPHFDAVKQDLLKQPGVLAVTRGSSNIIRMGGETGDNNWDGKEKGETMMVHPATIDNDFLPFFKMNLKLGDNFTGMPSDSTHFILNETAVATARIKDPIGKRFEMWGRKGTIIGVMKDFHFASLKNKIEPAVFYYSPKEMNRVYIRTTGKDAPNAIAAAEKQWKIYNADFPFTYAFLDETFNSLYKGEQRTGQLFNAFSAIAILISCLGLFGLAAYTAQLRTREIGVRKVLGASIPGIIRLLAGDFMKLVGLSIIIATPVAWYIMNKWLQDFAYKVSLGWPVFALAGLAAIVIAIVTISFQSIKAAIANPVKSLRTE